MDSEVPDSNFSKMEALELLEWIAGSPAIIDEATLKPDGNPGSHTVVQVSVLLDWLIRVQELAGV